MYPVHSLISIVRLMESVWVWPKAILLSGIYCISEFNILCTPQSGVSQPGFRGTLVFLEQPPGVPRNLKLTMKTMSNEHMSLLTVETGVPQNIFAGLKGSARSFLHQKGSAQRKRLRNTALELLAYPQGQTYHSLRTTALSLMSGHPQTLLFVHSLTLPKLT